MAHTPVNEIVAARRPRRADARRNYDALLLAAREAFAAHGADASLEDIARRAGVGIGTLYRNFPSRTELFEAVYADEVHALCRLADEVTAEPPWQALTTWLRRFVDYMATKRAIRDAMDTQSAVFTSCRASMYEAGTPLLTRAQTAGEARTDITFDDLIRMVAGITGATYPEPDQRDHILNIALDGVRTHRP
ncbi:TetR/AcrR family transcriptional regulator [Streptomyces sp. NBC_01763]|uniref:TetR/AcrR family transcriptional regulator n=1 Tax=Streptomyces sp. NBC_01763 TaxID=2975934 RepID=UPI002DDBBC2E|nr:helix-turn-helix domain-containing protein [Streptomyces sp. NBC_01763]WSC34614.1 TetR/AcrR family transcriptional regulator [Streptomyces sp. NBC_01763]